MDWTRKVNPVSRLATVRISSSGVDMAQGVF